MGNLANLTFWEIADHPILYCAFGTVIGLITIQTLIFFKKALTRANEIGLSKGDVRKAITASLSVSILPAIPIVATLIALIPSLGTAVPWYRLSVIGSALFESMAATMAAEAYGETLSVAGLSKNAFGGAIWLMSFGGCAYAIMPVLGLKPVGKIYDKLKSSTVGLVAVISSCCLAGVVCSLGANYFKATAVSKPVFLISAAFTALLMVLAEKNPKYEKLGNMSDGISIVVGMVAAIVIANYML